MNNHPINEMLVTTMEKIKEMVDVNTIVGDPITTPDGTTLIPVSRVSFGFASGGSDYVSKNSKEGQNPCFGGAGGAGVTVAPIAFVVISGGSARMLSVNSPANTTADRLVEMIPDVINRVSGFVDAKRKEKREQNEPDMGIEGVDL